LWTQPMLAIRTMLVLMLSLTIMTLTTLMNAWM
jgi:hypothetical protein